MDCLIVELARLTYLVKGMERGGRISPIIVFVTPKTIIFWYNNNVLMCCVSHLRSGNVSGGPTDVGQQ